MQAYRGLASLLIELPVLKWLNIYDWNLQLCHLHGTPLPVQTDSSNAALPPLETVVLGTAFLPDNCSCIADSFSRYTSLRNLHLASHTFQLLLSSPAMTQLTGLVLEQPIPAGGFAPNYMYAKLTPMTKLTSLRSVSLSFPCTDNELCTAFAEVLAQLTGLTSLTFDQSREHGYYDDLGGPAQLLQPLTTLTHLARLQLHQQDFIVHDADDAAEALAGVLRFCTALTHLELSNCEVSPDLLASLTEASSSAQELWHSGKFDASQESPNGLQRLAVLKLDGSAIRPEGATALALLLRHAPKLRHLSLKVCAATCGLRGTMSNSLHRDVCGLRSACRTHHLWHLRSLPTVRAPCPIGNLSIRV